jgi:LuxR family maltose regulon positive regulatory protein
MTADELLTTRYHIPSLRPNLVARPRLIARLNEGLQLDQRLFLIAAPAGFGKTTLLGEWIGSVELPVTWLSLDESADNATTFLRYLIAALQQVDEGIGQSVLPLLGSPQPASMPALMATLVNDLSEIEGGLLLVLDDYHAISAFPVHDLVSFLLDNRPQNFHLAVGTREDPPFPLARLRARGQITEVRERSLRFTAGESGTFLSQTMKLTLSPEAVNALETRTEGWITGLQLAGLALRNETATEQFIAEFAGDDRYIMDYLFSEVLEREPEAVRQFLTQTALLDRLTAPLCGALTGRDDSQVILEHLERANLFLLPLDNRRQWYRYHRLFAEVLRLTLPVEEQQRLHRRAMGWYEENGYADEAISHALQYAQLSGDLDFAERLIAQTALEGIFSGSTAIVRGWLAALPQARLLANPDLAISNAWLLAISGEIPTAENYLAAAETELAESSPPAEMSRVLVLRSFIALIGHADYGLAVQLASEALELLPASMPQWRVIALWTQAEALERTAPISKAIVCFAEAQQAGRAARDQVFLVTVDMALSAALNNHGRRREALTTCKEALDRYKDNLGRTEPVAGLLLSQMGVLHHEANQLEKARAFHEQGLAAARQMGEPGYLLAVLGFSALTKAALGNYDPAIESLQAAYYLSQQSGLTDPNWYLAQEANIRLGRGELLAATHWAETAKLSPDDELEYLRLDSFIVYARLLRRLDRQEDAAHLLGRLEPFAQERELNRLSLVILCQQAAIANDQKQPDQAQVFLAQALQMVGLEDYYRLFLEEKAFSVGQLLAARPLNPRFVDQLLAFSRGPVMDHSAASQPLVEPLSQRELEVLGLIVDGLSNAQIAQQLYIALGTVKRHINNIYGKLGVKSRTQAIARARNLELLHG